MENQIFYDVSGTPTKLTGIKYGSFHYHADTGSAGRIRLGGVCSAYIEFDYYTSNGVTLNIGDALEYHRLFPDMDNSFEDATADLDYIQGIFYVTSLDAGNDLCHVVAYDAIYKLNVDFSEYLKSIESSFPKTLASLLNAVTTVSGVTFDLTSVVNYTYFFTDVVVKYFYATGITCRDVVAAIASMCSAFVRATLNQNELKFSAYSSTSNSPWQGSGKYAICPDDGTYPAVGGGTAINVWYKEDGLKLGEQITPYNGVVVYLPDGTAHGDTAATNPYNFYFASSLFVGSNNMAYVKARQEIGYALPNINAWYSGQIHLFPFRFPFKVGQVVHVYDASGIDHRFPIMSMDLSESDCVIESYTDKSVGNDTQWNEQGNGIEDRSLALDVRVTDLESKVDGIYPNFKIYDSVTQLGLTSGSATIAGAYSALGKDEMLICPAAEFSASEVPSTSGCMVEMVKRYNDGTAGRINFWGRNETIGDYRMFTPGIPGVPSGTWKKTTYS